jgi:hypothetical protein
MVFLYFVFRAHGRGSTFLEKQNGNERFKELYTNHIVYFALSIYATVFHRCVTSGYKMYGIGTYFISDPTILLPTKRYYITINILLFLIIIIIIIIINNNLFHLSQMVI